MWRAWFGEPTTGRLARLPFLGFWLLLWVLFLLYGTGIAFAIGLVEPLIFDGPAAARGYLLGQVAPPVLVLLGLCCLLFALAQLNLLTKRIRDMGLPGWSVLLVIALIATGFAGGFADALPPGSTPIDQGNRVDGTYHGLLLLTLLLIPSGTFARTATPTPADTPACDGAPVDGGPTPAPTPEPPPADAPPRGSDRGPVDQDPAGGVTAQ